MQAAITNEPESGVNGSKPRMTRMSQGDALQAILDLLSKQGDTSVSRIEYERRNQEMQRYNDERITVVRDQIGGNVTRLDKIEEQLLHLSADMQKQIAETIQKNMAQSIKKSDQSISRMWTLAIATVSAALAAIIALVVQAVFHLP